MRATGLHGLPHTAVLTLLPPVHGGEGLTNSFRCKQQEKEGGLGGSFYLRLKQSCSFILSLHLAADGLQRSPDTLVSDLHWPLWCVGDGRVLFGAKLRAGLSDLRDQGLKGIEEDSAEGEPGLQERS